MDPSKAAPGLIVATQSGNYVIKLESIAKDQDYAGMLDDDDVIWNATVFFDASCKKLPPFSCTFSIKALVPFDAVRMGMMLGQMKLLVEQLNLWAGSGAA